MKTSTLSAAFAAIMLAVLLGMPAVVTAQTPAADTLIVGVQNDTPNLHPWDQATNSVWKSFLWRQWVYEGLFGLSPDGSIYPVLATGYTVDVTGLNVTVNLRTGVTFTDGQPFTADDVVFTFQIMGFNSQLSDTILKSIVWPDPPKWDWWNSTTPWGSTHKTHVGVEKLSATQVVFHVRKPYSMFFFGTMTTPIMPMHIWQNHLVTVDLSVFKLPDKSPITQGTEFDFDRNFGATAADVTATIGTGPWYLVQWTPLSSATIKVYDGYWGKSQSLTWQGKQWPFFPSTIKTMEFRIYGTLDVAILALKSGEVHIVPWNLPIGFYNDLRQDPNMGFTIPTSDGFFYLAFNMRKAPFDDLNFRKAVSLAVDKDFIVDRLLGGFGIKGQLPISPINPAYINSSAVAPPFDLPQARSILDAAGYIDANGDGWRDLPGGAPLKYSILTPAKDYDPTRADAGIMISNNLKSIGLNIDSAPTAFDAIVSAVFVAVQFDMYILGWVTLGPFPELYLSDFFGCDSDVTLGVGSNTPGFCNAEFEAKMNVLDTEMNDAVRIQAAKDAEGILARELPYDTLYNTRQIEAYRADIWKGWTDVNGEIFNGFSIGILGASNVQAPSGPLTISLNMPGTGAAGSSPHFQVYAVQDGVPADGVSINVSASSGEWATATTSAQGFADVTFHLPAVEVKEEIGFIAVGTKGTFTGGDTGSMQVIPPSDIAQLSLSTTTPILAPSGAATITAKVTNKTGAPIAGAPVEILPELVLGTIAPTNQTTNAAGVATFSYTAPAAALIPNRNQYDFVKGTVFAPTKLAVPETKKQTLTIGVENPNYDWYVVSIQSVSDYVVDNFPGPPLPQTSTVTVLVTKHDGTPVANEAVSVVLSNTTALLPDAPTKLTNGAGVVSFVFTANTTIQTPVTIDFSLLQAFVSTSGLTMLVSNGTKGYAMSVTLSPRFVSPNSDVSFDVTVYDETGILATDAEVVVFVPYNDVGNPIGLYSYGVSDLPLDVIRDEGNNWTMTVLASQVGMTLDNAKITIKDETGAVAGPMNLVPLSSLTPQYPTAWNTYKANYTRVGTETEVTEGGMIKLDRTSYPSGYSYEVYNGTTLVASGIFGYWSFIGSIGTVYSNTTFVGGTVSGTFKMKSFPADNVVTLEVGIGSFGPRGVQAMKGYPLVFPQASSYSYGSSIQKRNKLAAVKSWAISQPSFNLAGRTATLDVTLVDSVGAIQGANVKVYRGKGDLRKGKGATAIGTFTTGTLGNISVTWTEPIHLISLAASFTALVTSPSYALGGQFGSTPFEMSYAYVVPPDVLIPSGAPATTIVRVGDRQTYDFTVRDFTGAPAQDAFVKARIAGNVSGKTDGTGHLTLSLAPGTSNPTQTDAWETIFDITKGGNATTLQLGTLVGVGVFTMSNLNVPSSANVGQKVTVSVLVHNGATVGDTTLITLSVDGGILAQKEVLVPAGGDVTVEFTYVPFDTSEHTLSISCTKASTAQQPLTAKLTAGGAGIDAAVAAGLAIVLLIVGIIIGFFVGKRPKAPKLEDETATPTEEKPEEPKPEEPPKP